MTEAGLGPAVRAQTLARFAAHRTAWDSNEALRTLYGRWYGRVQGLLPAAGPFVELGSGPGFAREFIPDIMMTDVVAAPWHDREVAAERLPFADGTIGALVLFDVLHHLPSPARFFEEAGRVLRQGGRIVLCEPYIGPLSYPVYKFLHEESVDLLADPLSGDARPGKDPFDANQAIPTLLFGRGRADFEKRFPSLRVTHVERLSGLAYPASGGFSRPPLLPLPLWRRLLAVEDWLPEAAFRLMGFRLLAVVQRN